MLDLLQIAQVTVNDSNSLCVSLGPILRIVGIVVLGIKIIVPIILIIIGMIDLAKSVVGKDEKEIKEAQTRLIKRAIAAVLVFLVATLVSIIFQVILNEQSYKRCWQCINNPFSSQACGNTALE